MVYQCAIFQTSAAIETYLRLMIEGWAQKLRAQRKGMALPVSIRGFLAIQKLQPLFEQLAYKKDDSQVILRIQQEHQSWPILNVSEEIPSPFNGSLIYAKSTYPSYKNIKKLFARLGMPPVEASLNRRLGRDVETMIENFQSLRTALAHSSPPSITLLDVRGRLEDMRLLISAIDRALHSHVVRHGGATCWT